MKRITLPMKMLLSLAAVFFMAFNSNVSAQCSFNCIDTVNVSVNNLCTATITPSMVLKNPGVPCNYGIELFEEDGTIINLDFTRADIGPQYVGQTLKVRVYEAGVPNPNSCWSIVNIEDKLPPNIVCVGNDTIPCYGTDVFGDDARASAHLKREIERTLIDNCGNESVTVNITKNNLTRASCSDEFAAIRVVGYNVLDNISNITSCEDTIFYERFDLDSIDAPKNYVGDMAIDCNDPYPTIEYLIGIDSERLGDNSMPNIEGVSIADYADSLFTERGLCNFKMTTADLIFPTCGNTFKIVRAWTIIDWCESRVVKTFNQVIKVTDETISQNRISNMGPFPTDFGKCDVSVELPFPAVAQNECNNWTYTITIKEPEGTLFFPLGGVRDSVPQVVERAFTMGISVVRYIVEDACGNTNTQEFNVTVEDTHPPIPVCDYRTVVTLNDSFLGKVFAKSFDDGSYDICSEIVSYQVRRVDRLETTCETPDDFADFVKFCCADIGKTIMVELQVTDASGMISSCMTEAVVQFKGAGPSATCPTNIATQSCEDYETFDISTLAVPTISSSNPCIADALSPELREVGRDIDVCGDGYIDIEWFYNITGEDQVICTQRITFANPTIFTESNINWPVDRIVESCNDAPPTAEELAELISGGIGCSNIVPSEPVDREFVVPGLCKRIVRTWTVVDWCRFPANPNSRFIYEQTIDIVNSDGPQIDISGNNITLDPKPDSCRAHIIIEGIATDDCTPSNQLDWTFKLDLIQNDTEIPVLLERPGRVLERRIDAGDYVITWSATDECGNTASARQPFRVDDEVAPQAVCGFVIMDIDSPAGITISAEELDNGSSDNCADGLIFTMRKVGSSADPVSNLTFTCADIGVNSVELWVSDRLGNQSVCLASVDVRDGQAQCGIGASAISLDGNITTPEAIPLESAQVKLNMNQSLVQSEMTEIDGIYAFDNLETEQSYSLSAEKNDDYINGISTLDLVLMQRHILGSQNLDSPYKLIAADVNNNGAISAVDLVILRRLILGQIEAFADNDSWVFIDKDYQFSDPTSPFPFTDGVNIGSIQQSLTQDMIAIKVGDLNSNAIANSGFASSRSDESYKFVHNTSFENGQIVYQVIASEDISSIGYQIGLNYDDSSLRMINVKGNNVAIVDGMISDEDGKLLVSVARSVPHTYDKGDVVLEVTFAIDQLSMFEKDNIQLLPSTEFASEIYDDELTPLKINMSDNQLSNEIILHQNRPNPFLDQTLIEFEIPKSEDVAFELFDINGKRIYSLSNSYVAGRHQISINRQDIGLIKGIYYYQIHTQQRSLIRKMIVL